MPLLTIGIHDYTENIKMPTYKVNEIDVYNEWTDANGRNHRDIYRTSIEGSFTLWFDDIERYEQFLNDISYGVTKTTEGYNILTVYINNKNERKTGYFYMDIQMANNVPYFGKKTHEGFEVTIKER
jgi:hypothetical protein